MDIEIEMEMESVDVDSAVDVDERAWMNFVAKEYNLTKAGVYIWFAFVVRSQFRSVGEHVRVSNCI